MVRTLIVNEFDDGTKLHTYLPAEPTKALTFAAGVMDSKVTAYKEKGKTGSDVPEACKFANLSIKQLKDGFPEKTTYCRLLVKQATKLGELRAAFQGKTIEGVRVDEVGINFREVTF